MEFRMEEQATMLPRSITFNYEELKTGITEKVELYKNMVYTDENIAVAKEDRKKLNKLKNAIEDKRKEVKNQCLEPYIEFEKKIKELVSIIDEPVELIDTQVKAYEQKKKDAKLEEIKEFWESTEHPEWLQCKRIFDQRWLNATFSMKKVQEAITERLEQIKQDIVTLSKLPEFSFEATEVYKETLDMNKAISEGQRLADIQKRKAAKEAERQQIQQEIRAKLAENKSTISEPETVEPAEEAVVAENATTDKTWLRFKALLSVEEALALNEFFERRNITFGAI